MNLHVQHRTRYLYEEPVEFSPQLLFLKPRGVGGVVVRDYALSVEPQCTLRWLRDAFENECALATFDRYACRELLVQVSFTAEQGEVNPFDFLLDDHALHYPFNYKPLERQALLAYAGEKAAPDAQRVLDWFYRTLPQPPVDTVAFVTALNQAVHDGFAYQRREEQNLQTPDATAALGSGSCRDLAWFFIALARQLGIAARFVSGYVYEGSADKKAEGAMHAWAELYLPGAGWKGFDPANGILTNHCFIPVAVAHEPTCISPVQGRYLHRESVGSHMEVELHVTCG